MTPDIRTVLAREGTVPVGHYRPEISLSWKRCFGIGLDPLGSPKQIQIDTSELSKRREENDKLRRLAKLEMENLHRQIAGSNFVILFADSEGVILDRILDGSTHVHNSRWTLPGFIWKEGMNGTNALGLVAKIRQPAVVHGEEHYFKAYANLTCAAAPIFGGNGKLAGIIDATSDCRSRQLHTLALVRMSCITIENGLFRDRNKGLLIFEFHNRPEFLGTLQSALLAFDEEGFLKDSNGRSQLYLQDLSSRKNVHFDQIFRVPFRKFLDRLPNAGSSYLTDTDGSSFAVRPFNHHARKLTSKRTFISDLRWQMQNVTMVCEDPGVKSAMHMVKRAVELNVPILIRGKTGTGKELMARYAHAVSNRKGGFIAVNCAALPETLVESELFGHEDGAFTGAAKGGSKGLVGQANGGTLFLDEIGAMSAEAQAKLLRFLDRMEIRPVGNSTEVALDIQLISATNTDLKAREGKPGFRPDLLYRINTMEICLPPLCKRQDLHEIITAILNTLPHPLKLEPDALRLLQSHAWPGNIRELKGVLTRLLITCESGKVTREDLERIISSENGDARMETQSKNLADHELAIVISAYEDQKGNISAVSRQLGISRNTVYKKLKKIRKRRFDSSE
ncbi:MAG: sigma-54-dependent Fis family transcriptional regulator [Deltaproteobacteria bacterium]|nr:sigma-54-dependent Fis family transcriptional regulator [Deltaproteobacteria bacterium]MCF8120685.1 sigma-54-dependent Fis family transcriptional regulator [Deltaproteobacteria bacterium]